MPSAQEFVLRHPALDGHSLVSSFFAADSDAYIVVGGATGVPRGFYRRFALFAQSRGVNVVTTDFRGIGDSRDTPLKGFEMNYLDWSRLDLAATVDWASRRGRVWLVGHSLGGHAIGLLPEPNRLAAAYVCGTGAGWSGWMTFSERLRVELMWRALGPVVTRILGYLPSRALGIGEDLPMGVYRDWKRWCSFPRYFFDDPQATALVKGFDEVRLPIAAAVSTDDAWAPPASRDAFFSGYKNAPLECVDFTPSELRVDQVGHMGYFRPAVGKVLWPQILKWLAQHGLPLAENESRPQSAAVGV
jgi:predicted alpha/beta hydrolase